MRSKKITIHGRVQGVFFRDSAKQIADELGIFGWIKNRLDGTVEILARGEEEKLDEFIRWCKQGPGYARVDRVEIQEIEVFEDLKDFRIMF